MTDRADNAPTSAVVLAGAPAEPELKEKYSADYRAEVPIAGKRMAQHVLDALRGARHVGEICVVGEIRCEGADKIIPSAGSFIDNLIAGVKACPPRRTDGRVLVITSDIPMVTSEAIDDFIVRCAECEADFFYSIISKEVNEQRFPGMKRTYVRLAEGTYTGGNIVLVKSHFIAENANVIRDILAARKSPMKLAGIIGIRFLVRALMARFIWPGALDLNYAEKTAGRIMRATVKAVPTPYAEIGADVDKPEHIEFAESALTRVGDPK